MIGAIKLVLVLIPYRVAKENSQTGWCCVWRILYYYQSLFVYCTYEQLKQSVLFKSRQSKSYAIDKIILFINWYVPCLSFFMIFFFEMISWLLTLMQNLKILALLNRCNQPLHSVSVPLEIFTQWKKVYSYYNVPT